MTSIPDPFFNFRVESPACDLVLSLQHPTYEEGGPCDSCAFRKGTQANQSEHTLILVKLCVEGFRPFLCHDKPGLCRGYIAAMNYNGTPASEEKYRREYLGRMADVFGECVDAAVKAETQAPSAPANL